jgi:NADH dehydrogenase FAD-containing subunit
VETVRGRRAWRLLTIAVVGGGPTGVEVAGAVSELLRRVLARDYRAIPRGEISVVLLEAGTRILAAMPELAPESATIGMRVHATFRPANDEFGFVDFAPA